MIRLILRQRPTTGMGSASPRYELRTACCDIFVAADNDLEKVRRGPPTAPVAHLKDDALVICDLGPVWKDGACVACESKPTGADGRAAFCEYHRKQADES